MSIELKEMKSMYGQRVVDLVAPKVAKWNSRKLEGCCPFHQEKTPSFKYNHQKYSFKCFGCGESLDVFDYFQKFEGMTMIESIQEVKKQLGIEDDFKQPEIKKAPFELQAKETKAYSRPVQESEGQNVQLIDYLDTRSISDKTIAHFNVTSKKNRMQFNLKDENGVLCNIKERNIGDFESSKDKGYSQTKNAKSVLFGMELIKDFKSLIITEGEIDAMSLFECGVENVVSIPAGSANLAWIESCWKWLEKFKSITIWGDQDDAGRKFMNEACRRLGIDRTKYVKYKATKEIKDANGVLIRKGISGINKVLVKYVKSVPVSGVTAWEDIEEVDPTDFSRNIPTGFYGLDRKLLDPRQGQLIILTGKNGTGKTTFMSEIKLNALSNRKKVFEYSGEMPAHRVKEWMYTQASVKTEYMTRIDLKYDRAVYKPNNLMKGCVDVFLNNHYFLHDEKSIDGKEKIIDTMILAIKRHGIQLCIIDNLVSSDYFLYGEKGNKNSQETSFINTLLKVARIHNVLIYLIVHPRKTSAGAKVSNDSDEVSGSGNITNLANTVLILYRTGEGEDQETICAVNKNRDFGESGAVPLRFDYKTKKYHCGSGIKRDDYIWLTHYNLELQKIKEKMNSKHFQEQK